MKKICLILFMCLIFLNIDKVRAYSSEEIGEVMASYAKWVYDNKSGDFDYLLPGEYYHIGQTYAGKKSYNGKYGADCNAFIGFVVCNSTNTPCKQVALPNVYQYDGTWIINSSNEWDNYFYRPYTNLSHSSIKSKINNGELKKGDLVTSCTNKCQDGTHIQIYIGNGYFVDNGGEKYNLRHYTYSDMWHKSGEYTVIRISDSGAAKINLDHIYYPNGDGTKTDVKDKLGLSFLNNNQANDNRKTIYIGDSRTYGMNLYGITNSSNTVYGVGYGYNWFTGNGSFSSSNTNSTSGGIAGANSKMNSGEKYNIVIWLGVNDYTYVSAEKYYSTYFSLAKNEWKDHNIYIVSVGPVDDDKALYVDNKGINKFNDAMEELIKNGNLSNLNYIDLGYTESSINSYDSEGLHYGKSDYQKIFNNINNGIVKIENNSNNNPIGGNDSPEGEGNDLPEGGGNPQPGGNNNEPLTCNDFFDADMMDIISTIYKIIEFLAIILTIVLGMLDFAKGITSDDQDLIKKASKHFVKRLIICVVIFVLPLLIDPLEQLIGITGCDNADMINNGGNH